MSRRITRRERARRAARVRRLARSGAWDRSPTHGSGPGTTWVRGGSVFYGNMPARLLLTDCTPHRWLGLSQVLRLPHERWPFLYSPNARRPEAWPFYDDSGVTFFDAAQPVGDVAPEGVAEPVDDEGRSEGV